MIHFFPSRPVAISIFGLDIHWYGIMYALALIIGVMLLPTLQKLRGISLSKKQSNDLVTCVFLGVLLGGRLGYVLLYEASYFMQHPLEIVMVWHGGMSSHGGIIGVLCALLLFCHYNRLSILAIADILTVPIAIGLALGRGGNFINGELYGTLSSQWWAMSFPGVEGLRHPTQLYAVCKDLLIASVCALVLAKTSYESAVKRVKPGYVIAIFLILYGIFRSIVEHFREQPFGFIHVGAIPISWGQLYTVPVLLAGVGLLAFVRLRRS